MTLIDTLHEAAVGPGARRVSRHRRLVSAPPARVYDAVLGLTLRELPVVRFLFRLRGIPYRKEMTVRDFFTTPPFRLVAEDPPREIVFSIEGAGVRATGSFQVASTGPGSDLHAESSELLTETWVETGSPPAERAFRLYWAAIGPFSRLIRRLLLGAAKRHAEREPAKGSVAGL